MNFDFSDDQKMLRDQAHKFLSEKCTPKTVRKVYESGDGFDRVLWKQIAEMGWLGTAIPENYGGNGLGLIVGPRANTIAIEKALAAGTGWVTVRNSTHFGIAGYYALAAAEHGLIGW